jgi:hypothetical protein
MEIKKGKTVEVNRKRKKILLQFVVKPFKEFYLYKKINVNHFLF